MIDQVDLDTLEHSVQGQQNTCSSQVHMDRSPGQSIC